MTRSIAGKWLRGALAGVAAALCLVMLPGSQGEAEAAGNWFFDRLNPYAGSWKGRGYGRRKGSEEKEVISCKGIHKWLNKGREFEQSYTCWGGDFAVSGSFRIKPGKAEGDCVGTAMNGAKEVTGKIWGRIKANGVLSVNMKKNFSTTISRASLTPNSDGSLVYNVIAPSEDGAAPREILKITYKKFGKKKRH